MAYEYTSNSEPIDNWTSLFSIIITKSSEYPHALIAQNLAASIMTRKPLPRIKIYEDGRFLINRTIYDFSRETTPYFESNARKIYYSKSCGAFIDISVAHKLPGDMQPSAQIYENEELTKDLIEHPLALECD